MDTAVRLISIKILRPTNFSLKKGLSSRIWENLLLAVIGIGLIFLLQNKFDKGQQFLVGDEILGCVCSIRNQEELSLSVPTN